MRTVSIIIVMATALALGGCGRQAEEPSQAPTPAEKPAPTPQPMTQTGGAGMQEADENATPPVQSAVIGSDGKEIGTLSVEPMEHGVRVSLHVEGLKPGSHAVHFHEHGKCDPPDFKSAGGHYNPAGAKHGMTDMDEDFYDKDHHAGDMLNQDVDPQGVLDTVMVNDTVTLSGTNALLDPDGSALIIHAGEDDYDSQPSGNAGDRVACALIASEQATGTTQPSGTTP